MINEKIYLNFCEDLGPATKIVPTCKSDYITDDDIIFSVDDDIYYPPELLQMYLTYHLKYPNAVLTGTSLFPKRNARQFHILEECELLEGYSCVLYKKNFLNDIPLEMFDKDTVPLYQYLSDDLVLSNFLTMKGITILCFPRSNPNIAEIAPLDYGLKDDALHKGASGISTTCADGEFCNSTNYIETIKHLKKNKMYYLTTSELDIRRS